LPYIKQEQREELFDNPEYNQPDNPGELNFMFSQYCRNYIDTKGLSYQTINDIVGALEGAKLEFYARVVRPYEDKKIEENGDVY